MERNVDFAHTRIDELRKTRLLAIKTEIRYTVQRAVYARKKTRNDFNCGHRHDHTVAVFCSNENGLTRAG
jgi:hypothetical protein